jgi:predicted kinase
VNAAGRPSDDGCDENPSDGRALLVVVAGLPGTGRSTIADAAADALGAPVIAHDWVMSALRPYPGIQLALEDMAPAGHGAVGWSILCAVARSHLRRGRSVVLDGVARDPEIRRCRDAARAEGAETAIILTRCADADVHRSRVESRQRHIPNWYELTWEDIQRSSARWQTPDGVDIDLDASDPPPDNIAATRCFLTELAGSWRAGERH